MSVLSQLTEITAAIDADRAKLDALLNPAPPTTQPNGPPLTPQEIAAGVTKTALFDDLDDPSTIDFGNTRDPKFRWWSPNGPPLWDAPMPTDGFSVANSILKIHKDYSGYGSSLVSMVLVPPTPPHTGVQGWGFKGSAYIEFKMACDARVGVLPGSGWPAGWCMSKEQLLSGMQDQNTQSCNIASHIEIDIIEVGANVDFSGQPIVDTVMAVHRWNAQGGVYPNCVWNPLRFNLKLVNKPPGFNHADQTRYGALYLTAADNGGIGSLRRFINDVHIPECDVSWVPGDPLALLDEQTNYLILGGQPSWFDWVLVRQRP